jgi:hypothetical protein
MHEEDSVKKNARIKLCNQVRPTDESYPPRRTSPSAVDLFHRSDL